MQCVKICAICGCRSSRCVHLAIRNYAHGWRGNTTDKLPTPEIHEYQVLIRGIASPSVGASLAAQAADKGMAKTSGAKNERLAVASSPPVERRFFCPGFFCHTFRSRRTTNNGTTDNTDDTDKLCARTEFTYRSRRGRILPLVSVPSVLSVVFPCVGCGLRPRPTERQKNHRFTARTGRHSPRVHFGAFIARARVPAAAVRSLRG